MIILNINESSLLDKIARNIKIEAVAGSMDDIEEEVYVNTWWFIYYNDSLSSDYLQNEKLLFQIKPKQRTNADYTVLLPINSNASTVIKVLNFKNSETTLKSYQNYVSIQKLLPEQQDFLR